MRRWLDMIRFRARAITRGRRMDAELDRELRAHLDAQIDEYVAGGMSVEEAHRQTHRMFGGVENVREESRDARGTSLVENLVRDARYTLRALLREPMLLVAATISIALGVGGNIAVFSLARELVFAPPTLRDAASVVDIRVSHGSHASYQRWRDLDAAGILGGLAGYSIENEVNWLDGAAAVSIVPMVVTANFFEVLGVPVARGRGFTERDARAELDPHVAVVSNEFWQRQLRGDSAVIGRTLTLNGESYTVIGVLPPRLKSVAGFSIAPGVYLPLNSTLVPKLRNPRATIIQLVGRLKPGQRPAEARAALDALDRRLATAEGDKQYGGVQQFSRIGWFGGAKSFRVVGGFFALLVVVSLLVLLIACANVAGLLIARGTRRRQEIAIRLAIGGSRARLVQQLLVEGVWLAIIGTAGGVALSVVFMRVVNSLSLPIPIPILLNLAPDRTVLFSALGLVILTVMLCALYPALDATRITLVPALKREEPFYMIRRFSARGVLLTGQVAVSTILLVTAFLFVRNLMHAQLINPGFEVNRALVAQIGFVRGEADADHSVLLQSAVERVRALPGVLDAAYAASVPLTVHGGSSNGLTARIGPGAQNEHVEFAKMAIGPGYFAAVSMGLRAGREFQPTDAAGTPPVMIVNEEFVRRYMHGASPIGQRVKFVESAEEFDIVGVVSNSKFTTIGEEQRAAIFIPIRQMKDKLRLGFVLARTRDDPALLVRQVRQTIGELDRSIAVSVDPMSSVLSFALLPSRVGAAVLGTLGGLGLVLAAFGLYAMVSYGVSRRTGEIAIRSALGASRSSILQLVMRDASVHVGVGLVIGLGVSALITSPLAAFLVDGLSATDPMSFAATALAFLLVSALASWLPARIAMRVSPVVAMRLD